MCVCVGGERERGTMHEIYTIYREAIAVQGKGEASGMCKVAECDWREARACLMQLQVHDNRYESFSYLAVIVGSFHCTLPTLFSPFFPPF